MDGPLHQTQVITMSFGTAINCMDGRVQLPVIDYLKKRFGVRYVDIISEPGPNLILAKQTDRNAVASILKRVELSVLTHQSKGIAVVGHEDCAGNPGDKEQQILHLREAVRILGQSYWSIEIVALWVDLKGRVEEIS